MGLVPDIVHVIPVGYEHARVVQSALEYKADKVVLITHENNDEQGERYWTKVLDELENHNMEIEKRDCNIFDLYSSLGSIAQAIHDYEEESVYVNVATGSKVTAIAGMIASMVTNSTPYYAKAKSYGDGSPGEIDFVTELPHYPIDAPDVGQVAVLEFIQRHDEKGENPTKGELIHFSEKNGLGFMDRNVKGKGKYRLLDTHILEPLEQDGYVNIVKEGRTKLVEITEAGRNAIQAFRFLINLDDFDWEMQS
jgi:hypothetical protein